MNSFNMSNIFNEEIRRLVRGGGRTNISRNRQIAAFEALNDATVNNRLEGDVITVAQGLGADSRIITVSPGQSIAAASVEARGFKDQNPDVDVLVVVYPGVYKEFEINQHQIPMYFYEGVIVWTDESGRSIFSDRHIGDIGGVELRVYGHGTFQHKNSNAGSDQETCNFRYAFADVEIRADFFGRTQMWNTGYQKILFENVTFLTCDQAVGRQNCHCVYRNCHFLNGLNMTTYNGSESNIFFHNCIIDLPKKWQGLEIKDSAGNKLFDFTPTNNDYLYVYDRRMYVEIANFSSGTAGDTVTVTIDGETKTFTVGTGVGTTNITDDEYGIAEFVAANFAEFSGFDRGLNELRARSSITLTGTSGTADVTISVVDTQADTPSETTDATLLATFTTDLETSAANFASENSAKLAALGVTAQYTDSDKIILTTDQAGVAIHVSISNASGNLAGTVSNGDLEMSSATADEIELSLGSPTGTLSVSTGEEDYTAAEMRNLLSRGNNNSFGYMALSDMHFHSAGGNNGRGKMIVFDECEINIYKKKGVGLKTISRSNENAANRIGFTSLQSCFIVDKSGESDTTAIVHGDLDGLATPKSLVIRGALYTTDNGETAFAAAGYGAINIIRPNQA